METPSDDQVRAQVLRDVKRMDGAHRAQLALFLGHNIARDPIDEVGNGGGGGKELRCLIETCPLLRERYAAFLHENPSALEEKQPARAPRRRGWRPFALAGAALALATVPLAAQYAHQLGMVDGPQQAFIAPFISAAAPHKAAAANVRRPQMHTAAVTKPVRPAAATTAAPIPAPTAPLVKRIARVRRPAAKPRKHYRNVANWKFAPQNNPYFAKHWRAQARVKPAGGGRAAARTVGAYLNNVIHGNIPGAPEAGIVTAMTTVHFLSARRVPGGRTKVDVELSGPRGHYYEVFYVARESNRIVDRYYIPLNRTTAQGLESRNR